MNPTEVRAKALELIEKAKDATPGPYECLKDPISPYERMLICQSNEQKQILAKIEYQFCDAEYFAATDPTTIQELMTALVRYHEALQDVKDCLLKDEFPDQVAQGTAR